MSVTGCLGVSVIFKIVADLEALPSDPCQDKCFRGRCVPVDDAPILDTCVMYHSSGEIRAE